MSATKRLVPSPGMVILEEYELKKKSTSGFQVPQEDKENAPQIGRIITVGKVPVEVLGKLTEWYGSEKQMDVAVKDYMPYEKGMIVAYKKYQDFPITLGTKKFIAVAFENILFQIEEDE